MTRAAPARRRAGLPAGGCVAPVHQRGQVASAYFTAAYLGLIVPIIVVGVGAQRYGDFRTVLVAAVVLAALAVAVNVRLRE